MQKPGFGEFNLGALAGAVVGAIGGLFSLDLARAIINGKAAMLFDTPILSFISWLLCGILGWLIGGQVGPRVGMRYRNPRAEMVAGGVGGLVPVILVGLLGWYLAQQR